MSLGMPYGDDLQFIRDVVSERASGPNADFFNSIQGDWLARVQIYIDSRACPTSVCTWPAIEPRKGTFLNLYNYPSDDSVQAPIFKKMRREHGLSVCPGCGELSKPTTLDHFLPKDIYPHLCVSPVNLVPMCSECQSVKLKKIGDAATSRFFIHPYFDNFAAQQILHLEIRPPFDAPTFHFDASPTLSAEERRQTVAHMREMELQERYILFFRREYPSLLRLVQKMHDSGQNVAQALETIKTHEGLRSLNAWPHVFYSSVLENPELMAYLIAAQLPNFL